MKISKKNNYKILVVNCGSSSIKMTLFEYRKNTLNRVLDAELKEIQSQQPTLECRSNEKSEKVTLVKPVGIKEGLQLIIKKMNEDFDFTFTSVSAIGHRFVHGGSSYHKTMFVRNDVIDELKKLSNLAPLHNRVCLEGIQACTELDQTIPQIVVFDTAFHHALPKVAAQYAIPFDIATKYEIKRYGFHGISHSFLWQVYENFVGQDSQNSKIITLHLGNGCSATAISAGHSMDTSMGFTPAEGLVMGTRAGDIDSAIVEFLCLHMQKTPSEIMDLLNFYSGLQGVSELTSDMKTLLDKYEENEKARLAVDLFCYRILKYLGAYIFALNGVDAILFSGGIGENSSLIREKIAKKMEWYGVKLNSKANRETLKLSPGMIKKISTPHSSIALYVVGTDENLMIAQEVNHLLYKDKKNEHP